MSESQVIGSLLLDPSRFDAISHLLTAESFADADLATAYTAIAKLVDKGKGVDIVTVAEQGVELEPLMLAAKSTPSAANVVAYAEIVRNAHRRRELAKVASRLMEATDVDETIMQADSDLMALVDHAGTGPERVSLDSFIARQEAREAGEVQGVPTGIADLDKLTHGLQAGQLVILAARPAMGKSTLAMNIAEHAGRVLFFSLEMPRAQVEDRLFASLARIPLEEVRAGRAAHNENFRAGYDRFRDSRIWIDETPGLYPAQIRARARHQKRRYGLDLIVVDYLQLMRCKAENKTNEIGEISRSLKEIAKELHVPVLALSQLNRNLEQRQDKRPILSDLRESGSIEQDADIVAFLYRDEIYDESSEARGTAELLVRKHRDGALKNIRLTSSLHLCRFDNYEGRAIPFSSMVKPKVVGFGDDR